MKPLSSIFLKCLSFVALVVIAVTMAGCARKTTLDFLKRPDLRQAREVTVQPLLARQGRIASTCKLPKSLKTSNDGLGTGFTLNDETQLFIVLDKRSSTIDLDQEFKTNQEEDKLTTTSIDINGWKGLLLEENEKGRAHPLSTIHAVKGQYVLTLTWFWSDQELFRNDMRNAAGCVLWTLIPRS